MVRSSRRRRGRGKVDFLYSAGAKGPGRVLVFPWLDRCIKATVSDSAFSVPPQQLITNDGGIIEIGAEVQYGITDVVVMVREVADHQDILRSLGKTVLVRLLAKKHVSWGSL